MKIVISMVKLTTSTKSKHLNHRVRIWMGTVYSDFTLNFESHFFRFFSVFYSWEEHLNYQFYIVINFLQLFLAVMQHSKPRNTDPDQHTNFFFKCWIILLDSFTQFSVLECLSWDCRVKRTPSCVEYNQNRTFFPFKVTVNWTCEIAFLTPWISNQW